MNSLEFLKTVLPSAGHYCGSTWTAYTPEIAEKEGKPGVMRQFYSPTLEGLADALMKNDRAGRNTYMAMAAFTQAGTRKGEFAKSYRSLFLDLDCGVGKNGKPKSFTTKRHAVEELQRFLQATDLATLGTPLLLDSGGGVHVHWPLDSDTSPDLWKVASDRLKQAAKHHGFGIDTSITADYARVLRAPGTHNYKYAPPRECVVRQQGDVFVFDQIAELLSVDAYAPLKSTRPPKAPKEPELSIPGIPLVSTVSAVSAVATALMSNTRTLFRNIMVRTQQGTGCAQVAHYINNASDDGMEPLWRGVLSLAKHCDDGDKAAIKLSALHPYDPARMHAKLAEIKGPYACTSLESINPGGCNGCPHWNKITNPLALGREFALVTEETVVETQTVSGTTQRIRPTPPFGFSYGTKGGLFVTVPSKEKDEDDRTVMLLPYDFFMLDTLFEDGMYNSRFVAVRDGVETIVTIPNKLVTSKEHMAAALAGQNIVAAYGAGSDIYLCNYVRGAIGAASAEGKYLIVPPKLGWQADTSFAVGDTMYLPDGTNYTYVSTRLSNLIDVTEPKGTLDGWVNIIQTLMRKGLWNHLAVMLTGFGSALMEFAPDGASALTLHVTSIDTGTGKSLATSLAGSVWGRPSTYYVKPRTSDRTIMQRAGMLGSLPLSIDEVTNNIRAGDKEWFPMVVFDYSQGGHKLKGMGAANAEMRDDLHWKGFQLLTSNTPMLETILGARDTTSHGEAVRMLEWNTGPVKIEWAPGEHAIVGTLADNYGVAGRVFAQWLVQNRGVARALYIDAEAQWKQQMHPEDHERFWTSGIASVLAATAILGKNYANIIDIPMAPIFEFYKRRVHEARRAINTNRVFASDLLNAFIRENHGAFVKLASPTAAVAIFSNGAAVRPDSTRRDVKGRVEYEARPGWTDFYIDIEVMKRFCSARNRSYVDFVRDIQVTNAVSEVRKNLLADTQGPVLRVRCLKISQPSSDAP